MQCIICFGDATGVKTDDHFVASKNGHIFHQCCADEMIAGGAPLCPICDEDLRSHPFFHLGPRYGPPPPVPPRPAKPQFRPLAKAVAADSSSLRSNYANGAGAGSIAYANDSRRLVDPPSSNFPSYTPTPSYCVEPDARFKIVILGDINVGKSSLFQRYADDRFHPTIKATTGCDLRVKVLEMAGKVVRLNLWDTAGQERHRALVDMYLRKADGVIFCFDITDLASFLSLQDWYQFAQRTLPPDCLKIIVGNKLDLWSQRVVRSQQIQELAESWNAQYIYTSAKDATNVEAVFRSLAALILEKRLPSTVIHSTEPSAPPLLPRQQSRNPDYIANGAIKLSTSKKSKKSKANDCCN